MTSKERMLAALSRKQPDHLPATTHHLMPYFLQKYMDGINNREFFDTFGLDPIEWPNFVAYTPDQLANWRIEKTEHPDKNGTLTRFRVITPKKTLTMSVTSNHYTAWVTEHLIKEKSDIEILAAYMPAPHCEVEKQNAFYDAHPDALIRGTIVCADIYGQPGCWQDAACLFGIEPLILETYDDPEWVHAFLQILMQRKLTYVRSLEGSKFDLHELGGGDASSTVISPTIFDDFVAPYDAQIVQAAHDCGQKIVYHTCGGMMPILENIVSMGVDAIETLTPVGMGGDAVLWEAKRRVGDKVCLIGGFDQFHFFSGCTAEDTRREVLRCFEEAGEGGGFILSPSDHFFDADPHLIQAFADAARECVYR